MSRWKLNKKQVINFTWNLDNLTLDWCDLDQEYNFLEAPECDCGCGEKAKLCLYDDEDVKDFCKGMAEDNDCDHCAVFAINEENYLIAAIRDEDDIYVVQTKEPIDDYKMIGEMFNEMRLHCYGLIVYSGEGLYKIVEE